VAKDGNGGEYDLLDQVPDGRAGANPERDLMRAAARGEDFWSAGKTDSARAHGV